MPCDINSASTRLLGSVTNPLNLCASAHMPLLAKRLKQLLMQGSERLMEAVILLLVVLSPWAFGAIEPVFQLMLYWGVALLTLLWCIRILFGCAPYWTPCPVLACCVLVFMGGVFQLIPLPDSIFDVLSPSTQAWFRELLPTRPESLGRQQHEQVSTFLAAGSSLSLYP